LIAFAGIDTAPYESGQFDHVYQYIVKKESEGKAKKAAKIAGLNKFLKIYYTRVKEVCNDIS